MIFQSWVFSLRLLAPFFYAGLMPSSKETMSDAAKEIIENNGPNTDTGAIDVAVSLDGAWQKRGYSSLNGNVAATSLENGKVLDVQAMSRNCRQCKLKEHLKEDDPDAHTLWFETHEKHCTLNYEGSADGMKVAGANFLLA